MPRYFFHVHNDLETIDDEGLEFTDDQAARSHAIEESRAMAADSVRDGKLTLSHSIRVVRSDGAPVDVVRFGEAVRVRP